MSAIACLPESSQSSLSGSVAGCYNVLDILMIKKVFPILGLSLFSSLLGAGIVLPLLPLYAESLGATGIWLGVIFAAFSISNAISIPIFGRLSDRGGRKPFLSIGLLFYAIISLGFIWASTVFQLVLVRFLQGMAGGMIIPIAQAYIGDICPEGEEGKWMGYANAAFFSGFGFGPLMGGTLTEHLGMDVAFFAMGGLNLLAFFIVILFLPGVSRRKSAVDTDLSFRKITTSRMMRGLVSFRLALVVGRSTFMVFLPIFAAHSLGLRPALTGVLVATNVLLSSLLGIPCGRLADIFRRRSLVIVGSFLTLVYLALIPWMHNFWQLFGLCVFGSIGSAISLPAASALVVEEGRKFGMGSTIAVFTLSMSLGMAIGPISAGAIADFAGVSSVFYFGAAMLFVGTYLFVWFTRRL